MTTRSSCSLGTRICLGGEGMGLYGGKAITLPIDAFTTTVEVASPSLEKQKSHDNTSIGELSTVVQAIQTVFTSEGYELGDFSVFLRQAVPTGYGLASSATLYACITQCISTRFNFNLKTEDVARIAYRAEHEENKVLVGKTDTRAVLYRKTEMQDYSSAVPVYTELTSLSEDSAIIIFGRNPSGYSQTGESIKARFAQNDPGIMAYANIVCELIPTLATAWNGNDRTSIKQITTRLFDSIFEDLKIQNADYREMAALALEAGAYASKNIGLRGTGGAMYALVDVEKVTHVLNAVKNQSDFAKVLYLDNIV